MDVFVRFEVRVENVKWEQRGAVKWAIEGIDRQAGWYWHDDERGFRSEARACISAPENVPWRTLQSRLWSEAGRAAWGANCAECAVSVNLLEVSVSEERVAA